MLNLISGDQQSKCMDDIENYFDTRVQEVPFDLEAILAACRNIEFLKILNLLYADRDDL